MKRIAIVLLALVYPAILAGAYFLPGAGVRQAIELTVARDGSFTVATAHGATFGGLRLDYWAADLSAHRLIELEGHLDFWAHTISADGKFVAADTTDGNRRNIEVVNLDDESDRQIYDAPGEVYTDFGGSGSSKTLYMCGESKSCLLVRRDGRTLLLDAGQATLAIESSASHSLPMLGGAKYLLISNLSQRTNSVGNAVYDRQYNFYSVADDGLELLHSEQRLDDDIYEYGALISSDGTIAFQHDEYIEFSNRKGEKRQLAWPVTKGRLSQLDPANSHILFHREKTLFVVDALTGKQVAKRSFEHSDGLQRVTFQDSKHILILMRSNEDPSQSDRVIRWNWRDDVVTQKSVGGADAITNDRQLKQLACAVIIWLLTALIIARTSRRWITPTIFLLAMMTLTLTWVYCDPSYDRYYIQENASILWLIFVVTWLTFAFLSTFTIVRLKASIARRAAILVFALTLAAERLHSPMVTSSWFFPLVAFLSCTATAVLVVALGIGRAESKGSESARYSFTLMDLILLTAAIAVLIASFFRYGAFDLEAESMKWLLAVSAAFTALGTLAIWAGVGAASWWKRYPILLLITLGVAYAVSFAGWIVVLLVNGPECANLLFAFALTLTISTWMFRGITAGTQ